MAHLSEADIEQLVLDQLGNLGYAIATDVEIGPYSRVAERGTFAGFLLPKLLEGETQVKAAEKFVGDAQ